jgi:hypothetical protein
MTGRVASICAETTVKLCEIKFSHKAAAILSLWKASRRQKPLPEHATANAAESKQIGRKVISFPSQSSSVTFKSTRQVVVS